MIDKKKIVRFDTFFKRSIGLMFRRNIGDRIYLFDFKKEVETIIHMLFVFVTVDLIFMDKNFKIIEYAKKVKPFDCCIPTKEYYYLAEFKSGVYEIVEGKNMFEGGLMKKVNNSKDALKELKKGNDVWLDER